MSVMSDTLSFMRPAWWSHHATVSSGSVDPDYSAAWLCDINPGRPVRWTSGAMSATISATLGVVDAIVIGHSNLQAGLTVTIAGDIHLNWLTPTVPPDGIPLNSFGLVGSPSMADSFSVSISGNSADIVIGEIAAGALETIGLPLLDSHRLQDYAPTIEPQVDVSSVLPYDKGIAQRIFTGTYLLTNTEMDTVRAWYQAQRGLSRPSVIFPDTTVQDAWFVRFKSLEAKPIVSSATATDRLWMATLTFEEMQRSRW